MQSIRRIRPGDGPAFRDLRLRALRTDPDAFGSSYEREMNRPVDAWERRAAYGSNGYEQCLFVAESGGVFVGMAGAFTSSDEPPVRQLFGMWVAPEARSAGIGARLLEAVLAWSIESGAEEMRLWVVKDNQVAYRLYERAGFEETGLSQPLPSNPSLTETQMSQRLARPESA
jgi:ribosomal protein S18 acetylase RimI-like enzyme